MNSSVLTGYNVIHEFCAKTDADGRVVEVDRAGLALLGYTEADLADGINGIELFAASDRRRAAENCERILKGEWLSLMQCRIVDKSGKAYGALLDAHPDTVTGGLQCTVFLLPKQSRFAGLMSEYMAVFSSVVGSIPCGLFTVDKSGCITTWNTAAAMITGLSSMQVIGKACKEVMNCPDQETLCPLGRTYKSTVVLPVCTKMDLLLGGRKVCLQKTATFITDADGTVIGAVENFIDSSMQHETEAALEEARELAKSARRAKRHFMANMSHEIRTPINGILGMLDLLMDSEDTTTSQQDLVNSAKRSASLLKNLIGDILDFAIVDKGAADVEHTGFSLSSVIGSVVARQYELTQNRSVAIHTNIEKDVPDNIVGDSGRLYQILKHLVGNGIKFTNHGEVAINVARVPSPAKRDQADDRRLSLHFTIRDTGVGISKCRLEHIFESMSQADETSTRPFGGLGIGLSIVHHLVRLLDGRIWMDSEPDKGTTVHLVLPFKSSFHAEGAATDSNEVAVDHRAPRPAFEEGFSLMSSETDVLKDADSFCFAPKPLTDEWRSKFNRLQGIVNGQDGDAEYIIKELKEKAAAANQSSLATLLFRLLLALRREDTAAVRHYQNILSQKVDTVLSTKAV